LASSANSYPIVNSSEIQGFSGSTEPQSQLSPPVIELEVLELEILILDVLELEALEFEVLELDAFPFAVFELEELPLASLFALLLSLAPPHAATLMAT
jgi:hypothetical protein